ncbi:ferredoxin [[Mycobacterium] wendilense]|uniref:Ferredoxin n=1 Tax=[Mycobacterium] wendilense TaxID=3064284 RepID=A0ABM9MKJ9_9MYCO|nr:ferredoxin [Mycolicibacterium sp. MU0050]CAJ1587478.1 4Fe-4S binding protein [Mycolicibacterium sp. MU0050]
MTYVIGESCVDVKDRACIDECPVDCIYEGDRKLYINPVECIECGNCEPACPVDAIFPVQTCDVSQSRHIQDNSEFFSMVLAGRSEPLGAPGGAACVGRIGVDTALVAALPAQRTYPT